jgi:release factor glutamine methyltransferase
LSDAPTVEAMLRVARRALNDAGIANPGLDARVLAAAVLETDAAGLIARSDTVPSERQFQDFMGMVERRIAGAPVGRILGRREFHGLQLALSPDTLEPRPDTETLVDVVLDAVRTGALPGVSTNGGGLLFVDVGTGTGAIAIALAAALPEARGIATDIAPGALSTAAANAGRHAVAGRITFRSGNYLDPVVETCGLIVSNPPYVKSGEISGLPAEVRDHDPRLALDGGPDGLTAYRALAASAPKRLSAGGMLAVEIGPDQGAAVVRMFSSAGLVDPHVVPDIEGRDRVITMRAKSHDSSFFDGD